MGGQGGKSPPPDGLKKTLPPLSPEEWPYVLMLPPWPPKAAKNLRFCLRASKNLKNFDRLWRPKEIFSLVSPYPPLENFSSSPPEVSTTTQPPLADCRSAPPPGRRPHAQVCTIYSQFEVRWFVGLLRTHNEDDLGCQKRLV